MKLATAILLGASYAQAATLGDGDEAKFIKSDGTEVTLTLNGNQVTSTEGDVVCETRFELPSSDPAAHYYANKEGASAALPVDEVQNNAKLGYSCAPRDGTGILAKHPDPDKNAPGLEFDGHGVRIVVDGTCTSTQDHLEITSVNSGTYSSNSKIYAPVVAATKTYSCLQKHQHTVPTTTDLNMPATTKAENGNIVVDQDLTGKALTLSTTTDGKVYTGSGTLSFNLGVDQPHPAYFDDSECNNADMCLGKLSMSHGGNTAAHASYFSGGTYNTLTTKFEFTDCVVTPEHELFGNKYYWKRSGKFTMGTVCGATSFKTAGPQTDPLDCPYTSDAIEFSREQDVQTCLDGIDTAPEPDKIGDNTCSASTTWNLDDTVTKDGVEYKTLSAFIGNSDANLAAQYEPFDNTQPQSFEVRQVYKGTDNGKAISLCNLGDLPLTQTISSEVLSVSVDFQCTEQTSGDKNSNFAAVREKYLLGRKDGNTFRIEVPDMVVDNAEPVTIPRYINGYTFELRGLYQEDCGAETDVLLSTTRQVNFNEDIVPTGTFSIPDEDADNICRKRFTFTKDAGANLPLTPVDSNAYVCTATQSNSECVAANNTAITDGALVHLPDMCDDLSNGTLGGFVHFGSPNVAAKVICAGVCAQSQLYSLVLDWTDTFTAGLNKTDNELSVQLGSLWKDDRSANGLSVVEKTSTAYISSTNDCLFDGRLANAETVHDAECKIAADYVNNATGAQATPAPAANGVIFAEDDVTDVVDMLGVFQRCGGHANTSNAPFVYLNQQFRVDYFDDNDGRDALYCNTKKLTLSVGDMQGQVQFTMTVAAEAGNAFALTASVEDVQIKQCTSADEYKIVAQVSLEPINDVNITNKDYAGTSVNYNTRSYDTATRIIEWETQCEQTCGTGGVVPAYWSIEQPLSATMTMTKGPTESPTVVDQVVSMNVAIQGSPCDKAASIKREDMTLYLAAGDGSSDANCLKSDKGPVTPGDPICAKLTASSDLGDAKMNLLQQTLFMQVGGESGEFVEVSDRQMFSNADFGVSMTAGQRILGSIDTTTQDAGSIFRLVVDFEQVNDARRLRATYTFGAGDNEVDASIQVLPAVQVQDELEAGGDNVKWDEGTEGLSPSARATQIAENQAQNIENTNNWVMGLGIAAACVFVLVVGCIVASRQCGNKDARKLVLGRKENPYAKVRRSERFSSTKF